MELSADDKRLTVEGRIVSVLTRYGKTRLVAGPKLEKLIQELADEYEKMKADGL